MSETLEQHTLRRRVTSYAGSYASAEVLVLVSAALGVFLLAYDDGGYGLSVRATAAIALYWALLLGVGLRVWPRSYITRSAWLVAVLFSAFAAWTLASTGWATSAERAFIEFDRAALYLSIFLLALCAGTRANIRSWL